MYLFFVIPFLPILFLLIGLLGAFLNFLPDLMLCVFVGFGILLWVFFSINVISKDGSKLLTIIASAAGLTLTCCDAQIFTQRSISLKGFFIVYLFMTIICIISYFLLISFSFGKRTIGFSIIIIAALFSTIWSIGYELSYTIKYDYHNIAYYETIDSGAILDTNDTSVRSNNEKYRQHTIETYNIGEHYLPPPKDIPPSYITNKDNNFLDSDCYEVILSDEQIGFIFSDDVKVYFWRKSDFTDNQHEKLLNIRWYGILPHSVTNFCENVFEKIPIFMSYNLVT